MTAKYTFKNNGNCLKIFLWSDIMEGEIYRKYIEVEHIYAGQNKGRVSQKELFKDNYGIYILWNKKKVYLNDFDYEPIDRLVKRIEDGVAKQDRWAVFEDEILATFLKENDKVGIIYNAPVIDTYMPMMGLVMYGDKTTPTLCVLSEKEYKKSSWSYKVTLKPENIEACKRIISQNFYTSDLWSMIMSGIIKIVNIDKYKKEREVVREKYKNANKKEKALMEKDPKYAIYFTV